MRALSIVGAGAVRWDEVPAPRLEGDGQALVRPLAVAMCDLDGAFLSGIIPVAEPFPLGHECVAEVIEVGEHELPDAPGIEEPVEQHQRRSGAAAMKRGEHTWTIGAPSQPRGTTWSRFAAASSGRSISS